MQKLVYNYLGFLTNNLLFYLIMKVIHFSDAESYEPEKDWKRVNLCNEKDVSVEYFVKPPKHASPLHKHPNAQILIVFKGKLSIINEKDEEEVLNENDAVYIPEMKLIL